MTKLSGIRLGCGLILLAAGAVSAVQPSNRPTSRPGRSAPTDRLREVEALARRADPGADDWTTEILAQRADERLAALAEVLASELGAKAERIEPFFEPACRFPRLRREAHPPARVGDAEIRRLGRADLAGAPRADVARALADLLAPHRAAKQVRIKFKVIGVRPTGTHAFQTDVLFQAASIGPAGRRVQQNGAWTLTWHAGEAADKPVIRAVAVGRHDEITLPRALFTDCTRSVIADEGVWAPQLAHGCEHWYGRIDAVGEINFMGHNGIAVGDVNGDGRDDLYVAQGTGLPNLLFVQNADGTVRQSAGPAGVDWLDDTKGVLIVDIDNDEDQDLLCAIGPVIVVCVNDGTGRFSPHPAYRAPTPAAVYSLAAADYDLDGDLDIYACRYVKVRYGTSVPVPFQDANNGPANFLLRNDGPRGFADVTREAGLNANNARFSLAAAWADYDDDGDPDLYVANDFGRNNLYRNDGGRFVDVAAQAGVEDQAAGMGVSWSDFDLDGDLDLYVSNMFSSAGRRVAYQPRFMRRAPEPARAGARRHSLGNALFAGERGGRFRDRSDAAGVRMGRWAWGARFVDFNNDAYDDLLVPNGFLTNDYKDDL